MAGAAEHKTKTYRPNPGGIDYAMTDSPYYDPEYPAMSFPYTFMSNGTPVQAFMWLAGGRETKGCVILIPRTLAKTPWRALFPH